MKSLKLHFESLLDDEDIFYGSNSNKKIIENWIESNYVFRGKLSISDDFVVDCDRYDYVKNKSITSLTNGLFRWGKVSGNFDCSECDNLTSLEGAPEKVGESFDCSDCESLKSLKGAPKEVGRMFDCSNCENLKSLKGAPKKVGLEFFCANCKNLKITSSDREKYNIET